MIRYDRVYCRKHFFAVRVLGIWNAMPEEVVSADYLTLFARTLKHVNLNHFDRQGLGV